MSGREKFISCPSYLSAWQTPRRPYKSPTSFRIHFRWLSRVDATSLKANRLCSAIAMPSGRSPAFFAAGRVTVRSSAWTRPSTASSMISLSSDDASSFSPSQKSRVVLQSRMIVMWRVRRPSERFLTNLEKLREQSSGVLIFTMTKSICETANAQQLRLNETNPVNSAGSDDKFALSRLFRFPPRDE